MIKTQNTGTKTQIKHKRFGFSGVWVFGLYLCFVSLGFVFFPTGFVSASSHLTNQPGIDLTIQDVVGKITTLVCWFTRVALVLIVVAVIYYGVKFLTAQGDPTKLTDAKKSFLWGLVGVAVIIGTYTIIATIADALGADYTLFIPLNCSGLP